MAEDNQQQDAATPTTSRSSDAWIGGVIWAGIIAVIAFFALRSGHADVLLNVAGNDPLVASGSVASDGAPVTGGTIQILIEDPRGGRLLASGAADVSKAGTFTVSFDHARLNGSLANGVLVTSNYVGVTGGKDAKALRGSSSAYLNMTPPWTMGLGFLFIPATILTLVILFTGPLPPRKARILFGVTYVVTFSACVIPILLTVAASQSPYLLETMERAPVGIVKAKAKGLDQAQWLVNIGGSVEEVNVSRPSPPVQPQTVPAPSLRAAPVVQIAAQDPAPAPTPATDAQSAAAPPAPAPAPPSPPAQEAAVAENEIKGGLAIPLYVLVLAMLGAGINMTRQVPEIQANYDSKAGASLKGALKAPLAMLGVSSAAASGGQQPTEDPSTIRKQLIQTYMYFLSAPFLAIAVYYLLQVIASSVAEPVLVVIAFASGLMSNAAVGAIMAFADKVLEKARDGQPAPPAPAQ